MGFATVPGLPQILGSVPDVDLALVFLYGFGWGVGAVLYGLALNMVGLALTYRGRTRDGLRLSVAIGLTASSGITDDAGIYDYRRSLSHCNRGRNILLGSPPESDSFRTKVWRCLGAFGAEKPIFWHSRGHHCRTVDFHVEP
jgi:hypothetical protein